MYGGKKRKKEINRKRARENDKENECAINYPRKKLNLNIIIFFVFKHLLLLVMMERVF